MDVSLVFITVLSEDGGGRVIRRLNLLAFPPPKTAEPREGYSQVPEVDVVPQAAVRDVKQSVLIGDESAQTGEEDPR